MYQNISLNLHLHKICSYDLLKVCDVKKQTINILNSHGFSTLDAAALPLGLQITSTSV